MRAKVGGVHTLLEVPELQKEYPILELVDAFARLGNRVPPDVELGIHLCYGDPGHKHISECHRVVALKQTTLRGAVHGRS
jgi:hypothetical protein